MIPNGFGLTGQGRFTLALFLACRGAESGAQGAEDFILVEGHDWSLPSAVLPAANSGFFSEFSDSDFHVDTRVVDVTWRQLAPLSDEYSTTTAGSAQGKEFPSLDDQLKESGPFWMRIWASGVDWAPKWVVDDCGVEAITGEDYEGQQHLPVWNSCVWGHLMDLYREFFVTRGLADDSRLVMVYVPGAFTFCEFDFDMIALAAKNDGLTFDVFDQWFQAAMAELVEIFGENAHKLVYTGEDYPFSTFGADDDFLAHDAVAAGMGIRNGITELTNFHLSEVPAYGTTIAPDGHMVTDESWVLFDGQRVIGVENECYNACGFKTDDPYYAVVMSNLKALQLRANWIYVVPKDSYMAEFSDHWEWVRLGMGKTVDDSPEAWVALREAEDLYWKKDSSRTWEGAPEVRNLERWLVQRDVDPDGISRRGSDMRSLVLDPTNGVAFEGRATEVAKGMNALYFDVDDRFLAGKNSVELKLTYPDVGTARWFVEFTSASGVSRTSTVENENRGIVCTAIFSLTDAAFDNAFAGETDFRIVVEGDGDIEMTFVRIIKRFELK